MRLHVQTFSNGPQSIQAVVFATPETFEVIAFINGVEKKRLAQVSFDPRSEPAISSAMKYMLMLAPKLLEQMLSDRKAA